MRQQCDFWKVGAWWGKCTQQTNLFAAYAGGRLASLEAVHNFKKYSQKLASISDIGDLSALCSIFRALQGILYSYWCISSVHNFRKTKFQQWTVLKNFQKPVLDSKMHNTPTSLWKFYQLAENTLGRILKCAYLLRIALEKCGAKSFSTSYCLDYYGQCAYASIWNLIGDLTLKSFRAVT